MSVPVGYELLLQSLLALREHKLYSLNLIFSFFVFQGQHSLDRISQPESSWYELYCIDLFTLFFFYLVKLLYGSTPLVCGSNRGISFPIETSCFTLDSCVNSSEGLRYMRILSPLKGVVHNVGARGTHTHSLSRKTDVNHLHHIHLSVHYKNVLEGHMVHKWLVLLPYNKKITSSIPSSWVSSLYSVLEFKNMP